jgi:hypothetical protein
LTVQYDITQTLVGELGFLSGGEDAANLASFTPGGFSYEWAVAGLPFLGVASDEFPLVRGFTASNKDQFDNQRDPGEQSLSGWWLRSQRDFSGGAGITFLEPADDERTMRRFTSSVGIDCWTPGEFKLLRTMDLQDSSTGTARCVSVVSGSTNFVYTSTHNKVYRSSGSGSSTEITGWTANPSWLVSTGDGVFGFHTSGVDFAAASGTTAAALWTGASAAGKGWWVKQRLIAAYGAALHELGGFSGGALPSAIYTHPQSGWQWTAAVDSPGAILAAGYSGNSSAIYKFTVDETDGTLPTLTAAVTVAELPVGEYCTGLFSYLGSLLVIGTNKGIRIGQVSDQGQVTYGALTYQSATPVEHFTGFDRFVFAGVRDVIDGKSGVVRLDLSDLDGSGRAAYAFDVSTGVTGAVDGVSLLGSTDRVCVGVNGSGIYVTSASTLVPSGTLVTGQVRYNTLEAKSFRFLSVRRWGALSGTVDVRSVQPNGQEADLYSYLEESANVEVAVKPLNPIESLGLKFTLSRSANDSSKGPLIRGWQLKALPAVPRRQVWRLPLMLWDEELDRFGQKYGYVGYALKRWQALRNALVAGTPVLLQDFTAGETYTVLIEDIQLAQTSPPRQQSTLGGVLVVTCREL